MTADQIEIAVLEHMRDRAARGLTFRIDEDGIAHASDPAQAQRVARLNGQIHALRARAARGR